MKNWNKNKILFVAALVFNFTPSFSISALVSNVFVQPRYFWLPFFAWNDNFRIKLDSYVILGLLLLGISIITPIIGMFFGRQISLLDAAMIVNWIYFIFFYSETIKNRSLFNQFLKWFLLANFLYILLQILLYYMGLAEYTMLHSNIPFHVDSGYAIEAGYLEWLPRYTGLFIESGPLTLFLCITFIYILQVKNHFSRKIVVYTLIAIVFSQSKFLLLFIPLFLLEFLFLRLSKKIYTFLTSPAMMLTITLIIIFCVFQVFVLTDLNEYLSVNLIAYQLRLDGIKEALDGVSKLPAFGSALLGSNFEANDSTLSLTGNDIFSILFLGYGVIFGSIIIISILLVPLLSHIQYKYTLFSLLVLAFLSTGSLLVPHYTFFIIYCALINSLNKKSKAKQLNFLLPTRLTVS